MREYYDRYKFFRMDGKLLKVPRIEIDYSDSDLFIIFDKDKMRLDNLSYKYYNDPNYGWLLMLANPTYGSMEFDIPDNVLFRIPFPLDSATDRYEKKVRQYLQS